MPSHRWWHSRFQLSGDRCVAWFRVSPQGRVSSLSTASTTVAGPRALKADAWTGLE